MKYSEETMEIAKKRAEQIQEQFLAEVGRLLRSDAIDPENHSRGLMFGVALENIADGFLRGERWSGAYKNLIRV